MRRLVCRGWCWGGRWVGLTEDDQGALLRKHRTGAGLTQAAPAEKAGLSEQAVSMLERGTQRRPRIETIHALGAALGLNDSAVEILALAARGPKRTQPAAASTPPTDRSAAVPRQLPPTLSDFTGRRLTGNLPLAVRLIGARLAARPSWPVEYVVEQLEDEHRRLDELGTGDSGVRANIAGSVEFLATSNDKLDQQAAAALDLLGLPNTSDLITLTAAHLLGDTVEHTEQMLERLVDLNLLEFIGPGRYRFHD
ncbi:helix-turn-helix domain-containing protein [Kribbella qitaiheensis]|uniref:helix-turn-helix domain-containing protein n=1 Tax=Kribbella qitaiheensis TaxID=1544730 RepID=UPI001FE4719A|nr:helix-turn-helix transcriptional regulator [Kribbella qitaiheensis]